MGPARLTVLHMKGFRLVALLVGFTSLVALGGCGSDSGGSGGGSCPALSGSWDVSGTCAATSCTLTMTGCGFNMACNDGNSYSGSVASSTLRFSATGTSCNGTIGFDSGKP